MGITERREREKEQRQNAIIDAAETVFFSKGVENATMDEVAEQAELSKGTLYLYFQNKDDLYHAIILRGLNLLHSSFEEAVVKEEKGIDKLNAIGRAYYDFYKQYPEYANAMLHHEGHKIDIECNEKNPFVAHCNETGNKLFGFMQEAVKTGIQDGSLRPDLNPLLVSVVLWAHSNGIMQIIESKGEFFEKMMGIKREDIMDYSFQLMRCYLRNNPG
ncbi:MAG: TetR/AcrR family transcriptional regulator [Candidatus Aminicenantes bacterium]|nr:TetR/AcrR family transcriptional regulator [Candidatus Aminicenantes bacterium]